MKKITAFIALLIACVITLAILSDKQSERKVVGSDVSGEVPVPVAEVAVKEVASATNMVVPNLGVTVSDRGGSVVVQSSTKNLKGPVVPPNPYLK